ncbi:MAG: hypothetical protein ACRDJ4_03120 [Actinomycetota bacterium]
MKVKGPGVSELDAQGIPVTSFFADDVEKEYERLSSLGVVFPTPPDPAGPITFAVFDDTPAAT